MVHLSNFLNYKGHKFLITRAIKLMKSSYKVQSLWYGEPFTTKKHIAYKESFESFNTYVYFYQIHSRQCP